MGSLNKDSAPPPTPFLLSLNPTGYVCEALSFGLSSAGLTWYQVVPQ